MPLVFIWEVTIAWIVVSGFVGFIIMGLDKARAQDRQRRVPERQLFAIAFMGGAFGILAGSWAFHHKTGKYSFNVVLYLSVVLWLAALLELHQLA